MLTFQWNGLRPGDRVVLHDGASAGARLFSGVVTSVSMSKSDGYNGVGIRVAATGGLHDIVWPSPFVVHHNGPDERCWRCQSRESTGSPRHAALEPMGPELIDSVVFAPSERSGRSRVDVYAETAGGETVTLFRYYSDELNFAHADLTGLTVDEARALYEERFIGWREEPEAPEPVAE